MYAIYTTIGFSIAGVTLSFTSLNRINWESTQILINQQLQLQGHGLSVENRDYALSLPLFNMEALAAPERDPKKSNLHENRGLLMPEPQGRFVSLFKIFGPQPLTRNPGSRADPCASQQLFII